jgi:hypothetical protein
LLIPGPLSLTEKRTDSPLPAGLDADRAAGTVVFDRVVYEIVHHPISRKRIGGDV